jgi:hypothetical protein
MMPHANSGLPDLIPGRVWLGKAKGFVKAVGILMPDNFIGGAQGVRP